MWQSATEYCLLIQRMSCQDETKLPPPLLPPTAAPLNRHLQNRDFGEPDPDGPAVKVTRAASHSSDSYWLHQSQRNANHTCQGVLPAGSHEISPYPPRARKDEDWPWQRSAKGSQVPHYYCALSSGCPLKSPVFMCVSHSVVCDSLQPHVALQAPLSVELSRQEYCSG